MGFNRRAMGLSRRPETVVAHDIKLQWAVLQEAHGTHTFTSFFFLFLFLLLVQKVIAELTKFEMWLVGFSAKDTWNLRLEQWALVNYFPENYEKQWIINTVKLNVECWAIPRLTWFSCCNLELSKWKIQSGSYLDGRV